MREVWLSASVAIGVADKAPIAAMMFIEGTVVCVTIITPSKIRSHRYDLKLRLLLVCNLCQVNSFLGSKLDYMVDSER